MSSTLDANAKKRRSMTLRKPRKPRAKKVVVPAQAVPEPEPDQLIMHPILHEASNLRVKLSKPQLKKIKYGHTRRIKAENINHPEGFPMPKLGRHNRVLLHEALSTGKPAKIVLMDEELDGSGIKDFFRGVGHWFKKNWRPIVSTVLDVGAPALAKAIPEASPAILSGRELLKQTAGVGLEGGSFLAKGLMARKAPRRIGGGRLVKGSAQAKAHMAELRAMRKTKAKTAKGGRVSIMY